MTRYGLLTVLVLVAHQPYAAAAPLASKVYWTTFSQFGDGRVYSSNLDGTGQTLLYSTGAGRWTTGIVADPTNGKLYFGDRGPSSNGRVYSMNLDGSWPTVLATTTSEWVVAIDLDRAADTLYFALAGINSAIGKVQTDGTGHGNLPGTAGISSEALTLDPASQQLFHQNFNATHRYGVYRTPAAGGTTTMIAPESGPNGVYYTPAFENDPGNGRLYYGQGVNGQQLGNAVSRINHDGTGQVLIDQVSSVTGFVAGLQLSPILGEANRLYYGSSTGDFGFVDLANPAVEHELFDTNMIMFQIAVVPEPAALSLAATATGLLLVGRRRRWLHERHLAA